EYDNWGMNVNMHKTEYPRIGKEQEDPDLQLRHLKRCEEYKYLGSIISNIGTSENDTKQIVQQGRKCIRILNSLLWSNQITIATKSTIYRAIVKPILTYESECWQMSVKRRVDAVEMDFLRRSCRVSKIERIPNEVIRRRTKRTDTTTERIETRQLIWYGHVRKMENDRWPKTVINY
ncbi:hypothetical protein ILUMI_17576, partial [Ignelater luminosus]